MKRFKYSVEDLISGVRARPMLWDKTIEIYKDKVERRQAWMEICRSLEPEFDEMSSEDRRIVMDTVTNKWTNIRDTFTKSIRTQTSRSGTKPYQYQNEMAFLLKIMPQGSMPQTYTTLTEKATASDDNDVTDDDAVTNYIFSLKKEDFEGASEDASSSSHFKGKKRTRKSARSSRYGEESTEQEPPRTKRSKKRVAEASDSEAPAIDYGAVNESDPRIMNEDEAFFASLLPTVVRYSEDERLEFRIQVLAVMKSISNQRRNKWTDDTIV